MKAKHTLTKTGQRMVERRLGERFWLNEYSLKNSDGELIATVVQKTVDKNIHQVLWYGGEKHGKSDLTEGGIDGLMGFVSEHYK